MAGYVTDVVESDRTNAAKAEHMLSFLTPGRDDWKAGDPNGDQAGIAAMVFATLAVADAINKAGENGPGYTLTQAILAAGGLQP